ncbi:hypothetical protein DID80_07570 [Candidatus Marinamargulisbacteria bacterium SCGC AAA071-K20]|nr:hypothetical protein DID80_07570 [Candidatus Marinamargulisbacteria bacterium SCGC AAA071-K20]
MKALPLVFIEEKSLVKERYFDVINDADFVHSLKDETIQLYNHTTDEQWGKLSYYAALQKQPLIEAAARKLKDDFIHDDLSSVILSPSNWKVINFCYWATGTTNKTMESQLVSKYFSIISNNPKSNAKDLIQATSAILKERFADDTNMLSIIDSAELHVLRAMNTALEGVFSQLIDLYQFSLSDEASLSERRKLTVERIVNYITQIKDPSFRELVTKLFFEDLNSETLNSENVPDEVRAKFRPEYFDYFQDRLAQLTDKNVLNPVEMLVRLEPKDIGKQLVKLHNMHAFTKDTKVLKWLLYALLNSPDKFEEVLKCESLSENTSFINLFRTNGQFVDNLVEQFALALNDTTSRAFPMKNAVRIVQNLFNRYGNKGSVRNFYTHLSLQLDSAKFKDLFLSLSKTHGNSPLLSQLVVNKLSVLKAVYILGLKSKLSKQNLSPVGTIKQLEKRLKDKGYSLDSLPIRSVSTFVTSEFLEDTDYSIKSKAVVLSALQMDDFLEVWESLSKEDKLNYLPFLKEENITAVVALGDDILVDFVTNKKIKSIDEVISLLKRSSDAQRDVIVDAYFVHGAVDVLSMKALLLQLFKDSQMSILQDVLEKVFEDDDPSVKQLIKVCFEDPSFHPIFNSMIKREETGLSLNIIMSLTERTSMRELQFPSHGQGHDWLVRLFSNQTISASHFSDLYIGLLKEVGTLLSPYVASKVHNSTLLPMLKDMLNDPIKRRHTPRFLRELSSASQSYLLNHLFSHHDSDFNSIKESVRLNKTSHFPAALQEHRFFSEAAAAV